MEFGGAQTGAESVAVRLARADDLPLLADIEDAADQLFTSVFGDVDWKPPADGSRAGRRARHVARGRGAAGGLRPRACTLEGAAHLEQIAVHPSTMGQGIGTALLEAACVAAREAGYDELSLTTYADVPWNAPFYAARGFDRRHRPCAVPARSCARSEQAMGLDRHGPRVVMSRALGPAPAPLAATS